MNFTLCSSSSELRYPLVEGLPYTNKNMLESEPFVKVDKFNKKDNTQVSNHDAGKLVMSTNLMPRCLNGSYVGKNNLKEPGWKLEFVRTLLIDNYDSYTYNIYQELSVINGVPPVVVRNDELTWKDIRYYLYEENAFDNVVISPGPGSPTCPADIGICLQVLLDCWDIPILGVCLGHQALGYVHGAKVVHAPEPVHGRLSEVEHNGCRLFNDIPSGHDSGFKVVRYHSLVIDAESLPDELIPIAWTSSMDALSFIETQKSDFSLEYAVGYFSEKLKNGSYSPFSHSGKMQSVKVLMGIMHSTRPHYGVQMPQRLFTEVPGYQQLVNNADGQLYSKASRSSLLQNSESNASCSGMVDMVNLLHPSAGVKYLKLKWKKFKHLAGKVGGAKNIFCELFGHHKAENTFWLDSSSIEKRRARFSFMGGKGGTLWKQLTFKLSERSDKTLKGSGFLSVEDAQGSTSSTFLDEVSQCEVISATWSLFQELLSFCYDEKDYEGLPFDFHGGYVGYMGYSLKVECGASSNCHKSKTPDACFFFADNLVVIDHCSDDVYILSIKEECTSTTPWLDNTEQKLLSLKASATEEGGEPALQALRSSECQGSFIVDKSREEYIKDVDKCLEYIKDGESYELCLTTQMRKRIGEMDSLGLYLHLREKNPAPYAAWLNFSKENLCVCCSSPERFLRLDRNGILEAKPIKGTIARGATLEEDEQRKLQLQYSEKDQAENLMIVDLLRNDLGRVCEPGSVHVPHLMDVESYATVHTMVSTIRGKKRSDVSAVDCVRAAFPGGSMTGAPKLRSMELLDSIESSPRGIYSGSIGFFSYNQTFDLNIVIRTVVIHEGEASIGGGGAIVALSNPEDEYDEMILKTSAPAKAVTEFL
ncbi:hypothetical protein DVH24_023268 [Malus domestica]|uniref:aminodeoxychorismate synthase n=1 Tax=Malus domestica TaxID=3750 RepID=A0A498KRQ0_MALDO|nr:hypothetical protein DVH24_023268 [Malus domestica]